MPKEGSHLGIGLYSVADAARIVGVHPTSITRWISEDGGLISRVIDPSERTLTFRELMEIQFIKMFRAEGLSLQTIREVAEKAAARFKTDYPFSIRRFDTDGKTIFATLIGMNRNGKAIEDLKHGQLVFDPIIRPFFRKLEYRGARQVARYWPMEKSGRVVLDPLRKFGQPIDATTGVPTRAIYDATRASGGQDWPTVAKWLGIPITAVEAAVNFEQSHAA